MQKDRIVIGTRNLKKIDEIMAILAGLPAPRPNIFWVYVLKCKDESFYIGQTDDVPRRLNEHWGNQVSWTKSRLPVELIHYESFASREEATKREKDLKTGFGRKWLKHGHIAGRLAARQAGMPVKFIPLPEDAPLINETGATYLENARLKATTISNHTGLLTLAEDSGIEVDALSERPGIYSSRYAGEQADDNANNMKLLKDLGGVAADKRTCRYRAICVLSYKNDIIFVTEGVCEGVVSMELKGSYGFGYDPLFIVPEFGKTMAELGPEIKNTISHRAKALIELKAKLLGFLG